MSASRPDYGVWRRTSPFAVVFFLGATIKAVAGSYLQLAASFGAIAYLTRFDFLSRGSWPWAILLVVLAIGAAALLRYWFFRFKLEEDRILIRQGFVKRTALDLPFDRVQGINVERSLVDRILGLVTVRLDTAGTATAEGRLPAVNTELADWLRTRVDRGRRGKRASGGEGRRERPLGEEDAGTEDLARLQEGASTPATGEVLVRLTKRDILRIGLADRKALVLAGALAALAQAAEPFEEAILGVLDGLQTAVADLGTLSQATAVILVALAGLLLLFLAVIIGAFLRHHDFTLWRQGTAFRSQGGLLTQKEVVVEAAKIQQLKLSQNLVLRWFGRYRLEALPAGAMPVPGGENPGNLEIAENLTVPLLDGSAAEQMRRQMFGTEAPRLTLLPASPDFMRVSPYYVRALVLRSVAVPVLGGAVFTLAQWGPAAIASAPFAAWCFLWLALSGLIGLQSWRRCGYLHDEEGLASRRGLLGSRVDAFLFRKVQDVTVKRSPLQRRTGLATLEVQLSSGVVTVPYIARDTAAKLRDYILYRVESSPLPWH
ncbi:MAG: PH domain-containing protein [Gemmatimonadetes bacterium]|nr:PH domain-containing protein [Gemmatimonadota bacterium]